MSTMLDRARELKARRLGSSPSQFIPNEVIELAIAWAKDEIGSNLAAQVMERATETGCATSQFYTLVARALRQAVRDGILVRP